MEYSGQKRKLVSSQSDFPNWNISEDIWLYDPGEVLAKLFTLNWATFLVRFRNNKDNILFHAIKTNFPNIYDEVLDVCNFKYNCRQMLPYSRASVARAISSYINQVANKPIPKKYLTFQSLQFEIDVFMFIQHEQKNLDTQREILKNSANTIHEKEVVDSLISHIYNSQEDEFLHLAFGKLIIDNLKHFLSGNKLPSTLLDEYLHKHTSCATTDKFLNHFFPFITSSRKQETAFSKSYIDSGIKMGLNFEEIIQRTKEGPIVEGIGLLQSMPVVDAGPINDKERGQVISDFDSLLKYQSVGLLDHFFWSTLRPKGIRPDALGKFKGKCLEEFVYQCLKNLRGESNHRDRRCFFGHELEFVGSSNNEFADFTIHESKRCVIGQVKQIGWTQVQESATIFDDLIKNTGKKPFEEKVGLIQLKTSILNIDKLFENKELVIPRGPLRIHPVLVLLGTWLDSPHLKELMQEKWKAILNDITVPSLGKNQVTIKPLSIISVEDLYIRSFNLSYKRVFTKGAKVMGNPCQIFGPDTSKLSDLVQDVQRRYADVMKSK